jgi:hypothetical protein
VSKPGCEWLSQLDLGGGHRHATIRVMGQCLFAVVASVAEKGTTVLRLGFPGWAGWAVSLRPQVARRPQQQ